MSENEDYFKEVQSYFLACSLACKGECEMHFVNEDDPNTFVLVLPAENAINQKIEVKISIRTLGLDVMWYYQTIVLKESDGRSFEDQYRVASDIANAYNNFTDRTDEHITLHPLCINKDDGDIYMHSFYRRELFYPWSQEGTLTILKDILYTQPRRLEKMCYPIIAALVGKQKTEDANSQIERIRTEDEV